MPNPKEPLAGLLVGPSIEYSLEAPRIHLGIDGVIPAPWKITYKGNLTGSFLIETKRALTMTEAASLVYALTVMIGNDKQALDLARHALDIVRDQPTNQPGK